MAEIEYRTPTPQELSFLRIVTRGYPELEAQVEACEVSDYDPTGYLDVRVRAGPPLRREHVDGPTLVVDAVDPHFTEILLWINADGFLDTVEVIEYPDFSDDIYERNIAAALSSSLTYRVAPAQS